MGETERAKLTAAASDSLTLAEAQSILQRMAGIERSAAADDVVPLFAHTGGAHEHAAPSIGALSLPPANRRPAPTWDQETLRAVLESVPDAVIAADEDGVIVLVNRQTEDLFGYPRAE